MIGTITVEPRTVPGGNGFNQNVMVQAGGVSIQRWLAGATGLAAAGSAGWRLLTATGTAAGELDLVLEQQQQLLVVEVKGVVLAARIAMA